LALDIVVNAHAFAQTLPPEEKYDLAPQLRRASKSICANIAEGYGRYHYLDSLKFFSNARGSLNETLSHFVNARVLEYIEQTYFEEVHDLIRHAERALNGYMSYVRKQRSGEETNGTRTIREEGIEYETDVDLLPTEERESPQPIS
jgi:four helix bundle protein